MTREQKDGARRIVSDPAFRPMVDYVMSTLPVATADQILFGGLDGEKLAYQHAFLAGAKHACEVMYRVGAAPKADGPKLVPRGGLKPETF